MADFTEDPEASHTESSTNVTSVRNISEFDRIAALKAGPTPIPRRFVYWIIIGFAILGIGGVIGDRVLGNGSASTPAALAENTGGENGVPTTTLGTSTLPATPSPQPGPSVSAPLDAFLGLKTLSRVAAPAITLSDQYGHQWSLANAKGRIAVVTFVNSACNDACDVLAKEIGDAEKALGSQAKHVLFVIINTDPLETSLSPTAPLLSQTSLGTFANVTYLTGSIKQLSPVWSHYGVAVEVQPATRTVAHNEIMYFIDSSGRMAYRITPFANEGASGVFSLSTSQSTRFGKGIATVALKTERGT